MSVKRQDLSSTLVLGRYRVVQPIARGGMGIVYLARTEGAAGFARPVVIKRIVPDLAADETAAQAFVREARILSNLQHPGIVNVIDFDEEDGAYVMVLEYVHGYNVGQWHRYIVDTRAQMPVDHAVYVMTNVLDALQYAHTFTRTDGTPMQIVHRDVSPGNILIDTQGHIKLLDFGIARANEGGEYRTRDGFFKGKLAYAAPEIYEGSTASPQSDVYSAGVVLYQLLAGENPFRGKDMPEIIRRVLTQKPVPLSARREDISDALEAALEIALAKNPADRFPSAAAFAEALLSARTRRQQDVVSEFVDALTRDFNSDMPAKLGLEPLAVRDNAWRAAQSRTSDRPSRLGSTPPPGPQQVALEDLEAQTLLQSELDALEEAAKIKEEAAKPPASRTPLVAGLAAVALLAVAAAVWFARRPEAPAARFVVVEKQAAGEPLDPGSAAAEPPASTPAVAEPAAPPSTSQAAEAPEPPAPASAATAPPSLTAARAAGPPDPAALSRVFQRQRGSIEGCFRQHVKEVDGRPEVSIRFRIAATGRVQSADLSPASLNGTPLGQCLVSVARSTDFGAQSEAVSFTIPITARRVK